METSKYNFLHDLRPDRFFLMAGPCVIEDETSPLFIAETLKGICQKLDIPLVSRDPTAKPTAPVWIRLLASVTKRL